jgi:hypothetical protein
MITKQQQSCYELWMFEMVGQPFNLIQRAGPAVLHDVADQTIMIHTTQNHNLQFDRYDY